jgi:chromosome segregation ATPase
MNTDRTPEQIAAELYPYDEEVFLDVIMADAQRAAWLSRQPEVDELKRQVAFIKKDNEVIRRRLTQANVKIGRACIEYDNLKISLDELRELSDSQAEGLYELQNRFTAKEKEVKRWKKSYQNLSEVNAAKFEKIAELQAENERLHQQLKDANTQNVQRLTEHTQVACV